MNSDTNGSAPERADGERNDPERLAELLETLAEGVEAPENGEPGPTARLIRGACLGLAGRRTASDLLARHAAAWEVNGVRLMALGFSLRRFESAEGEAAPLPEQLSVRLRGAADPGAEAGLIAQELAGRMRVKRLIAARLSKGAEATDPGAEPDVEPASPEFLALFAPGREAWERLESWARETGRGVARKRMRALLDAAGVDGGYDIERLVQRLDVEFYFRFGYTLAACEEELLRADS